MAGYVEQAATVLDEAIALKPVEPAVRREVGDVLVATGRLKPALAWFEELAATAPADAELQVRLAEVTVWAGEYAKGLARLEPILKANFERPDLWRTFADAASSVDRMTDSQIDLAGKIADRKPPDAWGVSGRTLFYSRLAWAFQREADRAKAQGLAARARKLLDLAVAEKPTDPAVRLELAGVLTAARRLGAALTLYESLALERPGDPDLLAAIAKLTLWDGRPEPALEKLEALLKANFERRELWPWFAAAAADVKRLTRPQLDLLVRLVNEPTDAVPEPALYRARLAVALHREATALGDEPLVERAAALFEKVVVNPPADPQARRDLAGLLAAAGKAKMALELVRGLDTSDAAGRALMADLYAAAGHMPAAEREARELVKLRPDWDSRFKLADILGWNHKYAEARALYAALAKEHDDPRMPLRLAQMALWSGSHDDALLQYARLVEKGDRQDAVIAGYIDAASGSKKLDPTAYKKSALVVAQALDGPDADDPAILSRLAYTLSRLKEPAKAVELLERALELDPDSRPIRQQLAEALTDAGRYDEAEKHYRVLLQKKRGR
jgi:tetratricopeptide (TPR) repeat protein